MAPSSNLRLKGNRFHFRRKVPPRLRERLGRAEWVRSLETSDRRLAAARAREAWLATEGVLRRMKDDPTITRADIDRLVREALDDLAWSDEVRLARHGRHFDVQGPAPADFDEIALESYAEGYRAALARNDIAPVRHMIEKYAGRLGLAMAAGSVDERLVGRALLRALVESCAAAAERFRTEIRPHVPELAATDEAAPLQDELGILDELGRAPAAPTSPTRDGQASPDDSAPLAQATRGTPPPLFSEAWAKYCEDRLALRKATEGDLAHRRSSIRLWQEIVGDRPVDAYRKTDAAEFRRTVARMPKDYHRDKRWRGQSIPEMIRAADAIDARAKDESKRVARMEVKTVNRHVSILSTLWIWMREVGLLPGDHPNVFAGLHVKQKKSTMDIREERNMWPPETVRALLATPVWTGCKSRGRRALPGPHLFLDWKFWVPLIGAFTGMRREEVCALKVKDVKRESGVWYIDLRNADMKLKTPGSQRYVPLHQTLLDTGLVEDLVKGRSPGDYLFPDLKPSTIHKRHGDPFTKWFTPYRRSVGLYEPKLDFHSFRHTVSTLLLNARAHQPWIEEIVGHESSERRSELARYNKGILLQNLKATIDLLGYGADLSHLRYTA